MMVDFGALGVVHVGGEVEEVGSWAAPGVAKRSATMVRAPVWCWIMPVRKRWSKVGPVAWARVDIWRGVSMPGMGGMSSGICMPPMSMSMWDPARGMWRSWSHCRM